MDLFIYFLGPLIFGIAAAKILGQRYTILFIGAIGFFLAWSITQTIFTVLQKFHFNERSFILGLIVCLSAGIFEESTRYLIFRKLKSFNYNYNWNSSTMYALGHHGMETIIVGVNLLLTYFIVIYKLSELSHNLAPLEQCKAILALDNSVKIYNAFERLFVGLIGHACFSGVVMLSIIRSDIRWLFLSVFWHFSHNLIGFNLYRLGEHWLIEKSWVAIVTISFSYILFRLHRTLNSDVSASHIK